MMSLTLSLGFKVRSMILAASNDLLLTSSVAKMLFLMTRTTSLGLGVADAMYQGLKRILGMLDYQ